MMKIYLTEEAKTALVQTISAAGAQAVTLLAEYAQGDASHPDSYAAGYLQGYVHGADAACDIVERCGA